MSDLQPIIEQAAQSPMRAQNAGESAQAHPILDQIAADRYIKSNAAVSRRGNPFRTVKARPPNSGDVNLGRDCGGGPCGF